jgi:hypothetical protein
MRSATRLQLQFARVDYDGCESVAVVRMLIRPRDHDWFYCGSYCVSIFYTLDLQAGSGAYGQRVGKSGRPLSPVMDDDAFVGFLNEAARRIL